MTFKVKPTAQGSLVAICFLIVSNTLIMSSCKTEPPKTHSFSQTTKNQVKSFVDSLQKTFPVPGLVVALVSNDSVYTVASGVMNKNQSTLTTSTPLFTGAISEPILASVVLGLHEEEKLDLDERVVKYLPYFQMGGKNYSKITVRHLLTHTSGIDKYDMIWDRPEYRANAPEVTTRSILSQQPKFETPGERVLRSPYNYDILADLVAKVTKSTFEAYADNSLLSPLGMKSSSFIKPQKASAMPFKIANWLTYDYQQDTIYPYNPEHVGSNGFHSTANDLALWMKGVLGESPTAGPFSGGVREELLAVQFKTGKQAAVGLGFEIAEEDGRQFFVKGSHYAGFNSQMVLLPEKRVGVVVLSNISGYTNISAVSKQLAVWLDGGLLHFPKVSVGILLSRKFEATKSVDSVRTYYRQLKETSPHYDFGVESLAELGINMLHKTGDKQNAVKMMKFCVEQFPKSAYAQMYLAEAYVIADKIADCKKALAKAKSLPAGQINQQQLNYINEHILIREEKKLTNNSTNL